MKKQTHGNGFALSEMLYGQRKTESNLANSISKINPFDRPPSLIPGVKYPITAREREIINLTWQHCRKMGGGHE